MALNLGQQFIITATSVFILAVVGRGVVNGTASVSDFVVLNIYVSQVGRPAGSLGRGRGALIATLPSRLTRARAGLACAVDRALQSLWVRVFVCVGRVVAALASSVGSAGSGAHPRCAHY